MTLPELYLLIAGVLGALVATARAAAAAARAYARRRLRRSLVIDLTPFIPAGALRHRPPAN